jgi:membrane protease YdiL (CAAX protease family)
MIQIKGFFSRQSAPFHVIIFIYFLLFGFVLAAICGFFINTISSSITGKIPDHPSDLPFYTMHLTQFAASLFLFALPAFGTAYCCSLNPAKFLHLEKVAKVKVLLLASLILFFALPAIDFTAYFNSKMTLPEFMAPIENWMRKNEDLTADVTEKLLSTQGILPFVTNILIIGVIAGITEELLFRGALLSLLRKKNKNPHMAIWVVAIVFSAIHFQFYGFVPRLILGAILGYLLYWSHSIWVPIFIHFLNNTIVLIGYKSGFYDSISDNSSLLNDSTGGTGEFLYKGVIAVIGLILLGFCARAIKKICAI